MTATRSDDVTPTSYEGLNLWMTDGVIIKARPSDKQDGAAELSMQELNCETVDGAGITAG